MSHNSSADRIGLGLFLGFLGVIMFGGTLPFTRMAVTELSPWFVTFGRASVAGVIALLILFALRKKPIKQKNLFKLALSALCLVIGFPVFMGIAMQTVPSSHGGVVLGVMPLLTAVFATLFAGEKATVTFWVWSAVGAALVVTFALQDGGLSFGLGDIWLAIGGTLASLGYAFSGVLSRKMPGWEVISRGLVLSLPVTLTGAFLTFPEAPENISSAAWTGFAYVALVSMFLGFVAWNAGMALGGVAKVGQLQLLQTFVTLIIAALLLGEPLTLNMWLFATLILATVLLGQRARVARL
ncbi:MAG: DMT family transporter [Hyphomicrobiales bacterium]